MGSLFFSITYSSFFACTILDKYLYGNCLRRYRICIWYTEQLCLLFRLIIKLKIHTFSRSSFCRLHIFYSLNSLTMTETYHFCSIHLVTILPLRCVGAENWYKNEPCVLCNEVHHLWYKETCVFCQYVHKTYQVCIYVCTWLYRHMMTIMVKI